MPINKSIINTIILCCVLHQSYAQIQENKPTDIAVNNIDKHWTASAMNTIDAGQYDILRQGNNNFTAINHVNKLGFITSVNGYEVKNILTAQSTTPFNILFELLNIQGSPTGSANNVRQPNSSKIIYPYQFGEVEYINTKEGFRQNFIVNKKTNNGILQVSIRINSPLSYNLDNNNRLLFLNPKSHEIAMVYDQLKAWDANSKPLPAVMKLKGNVLTLEVNDKNAKYPVTIDPLNHAYEWATSSDAVLPSLLTNTQLQMDALYGYSSAGLGDVNNDGYDDVAVGAPGAVDIVAGNTFVQAGAVFIYYGSPSGLSTTPSKVLWANTPVAGALFGMSIAAGDVLGNSTNDIIIGAPLDTYTTLASTIIVGTSSVSVSAGKVYIFRGEDLTSSAPSAFAEIKLTGSTFFSNGIAGLALSNVTNKALFGFSVAAADDLNGDGKADLLVGVPGYLGVNLLSARSGAAFVYFSNNLSTTTPVQLTTPSPSLLGLASLPLANTDGLLFGFSIDGAGDFNGDGYPDVVVGAPAGINLNSIGGIFTGKLLSGSAYVFYGNGTGINSVSTSRLDPAAGGLLSTAANLHGYSVKGVRNASRQRNGRILVGAPAGNVLSNITSGLKLKTGNLNLYKTYAAGVITPSQVISSPRGSSLLSILSGNNVDVSALFGASMDNVMDINCDGISDIVVGEPLSTGVGLIGVNAVGGAAIVLTGKPDGTYNTSAFDMMTTVTSMDLGVNVASMIGWSVSGAGLTYGNGFSPRVLTGAPGKALDFGVGLLNIGSTISTLWSFSAVNNGLGKAFAFSQGSCSVLPTTLLSFQGAKQKNQTLLSWNTTDEINVDHFQIGHSTDGIKYNIVGSIKSSDKSAGKHSYKLVHETPVNGINYYKLFIIDSDKRTTVSGVVQLNFNGISSTNLSVQPNPVSGKTINILFDGMQQGKYRCDLVSNQGQKLISLSAQFGSGSNKISIERNHFSAGLYAVNIYDHSGKLVGSKRVVLL